MINGAGTIRKSLKMLAVMEASTVTGPAKNLIDFCRRAREISPTHSGLTSVETTLVTFHRKRGAVASGQWPVVSGQWEADHSDRSHEIDHFSHTPFVAAALESGIEVDVIDERFRFDPSVIASLREIVERRAPDIIQTHNVKSHFLVRQSGLWRMIPWIAFHHGYTATDLKMRAYNQLDRWSLRVADRIVTMSNQFARDLARAGAPSERISVLHNAVNADAMERADDGIAQTLRAGMGIADDERVLLAVGRLSREKGHADLISALAYLNRSRPDIRARLVMVGSGPERQNLEQLAASLGINEQIIFAGQVRDVRPYYQMADAMALPSHSEGSPNVLLEAMAARLPAVATAVGGVPEIVTDRESALLVEARNPQAMAEAITLLLTDAEFAKSLARNARAVVERDYSPESRFASLLEIYRGLVPASSNAQVA